VPKKGAGNDIVVQYVENVKFYKLANYLKISIMGWHQRDEKPKLTHAMRTPHRLLSVWPTGDSQRAEGFLCVPNNDHRFKTLSTHADYNTSDNHVHIRHMKQLHFFHNGLWKQKPQQSD